MRSHADAAARLQFVGSFGQPLFLNNVVRARCGVARRSSGALRPTQPGALTHASAPAPLQARLAGDWFPINERDMAVTVSVIARSVRQHGPAPCMACS